MNREKAIEELKEVNNSLTLLMKKKHALQDYIQEEDDRITGLKSPRARALELKKDKEFIKQHGRERSNKEIALIMNYSERQIHRFLNNK